MLLVAGCRVDLVELRKNIMNMFIVHLNREFSFTYRWYSNNVE